MYVDMEVDLHAFLTLLPEEDDLLASFLHSFTPLNKKVGGPQSLSGC
jgi:hypothetical protein